MFTGIIEATAGVVQKTDARLQVERPPMFDDVIIGASIAVSGVCLSVAAFDDTVLTFDVVPETWQKSALGALQTGDRVNLERAVPANGRLDGHIVQGHVEGVGECISLASGVLSIRVPRELIKFCIQKGSVTINGVSLTLATVQDDTIAVALVPHTVTHTNLGALAAGDNVNLETDILGRYLYAFTHED